MSSEQLIAYRVSGHLLASKISTIIEVSDPLPVNPVGGTKSWFLGVSAKKGQLLPVSDLGEYACLSPSRGQPGSKLLVVSHQGESIGLTVDEVIGLADVDLPAVDLPAVGLPAVDLPAVDLPAVDLPAVDLQPATTDAPDNLLGTPLAALQIGQASIDGQWASIVDLGRLLDQDQFVAVGEDV